MIRIYRAVFAAMTMLPILAASANAKDPAVPELPPGVTFLGAATVTGMDRYRFESGNVGKSFFVDVMRIDAMSAPRANRVPVVLVPDGTVLTTLVPAIASLGRMDGLPSMIIVGISYDFGNAGPQEAAVQGWVRRFTDFTPDSDAQMVAALKPSTQQLFGVTWPEDAPFGRSDAFLAFLDEEIKPFIAGRYPDADVRDATLIGHSLGGLFALNVLFTSPHSFSRYIALDPTNWGDVLDQEGAVPGDVSARLFLGASARLSQGVPPGALPAADHASLIDSRIREHVLPGLHHTFRIFVDESHNSLPAAGIAAGLREVFAPPGQAATRPPADGAN